VSLAHLLATAGVNEMASASGPRRTGFLYKLGDAVRRVAGVACCSCALTDARRAAARQAVEEALVRARWERALVQQD